MTGNELRKRVASIMLHWVGGAKGSAVHKEIMKLYNNHKPLARGVKMVESYDWCAATVSAAWIKAGIAQYTGTECSCGRFIEIAKQKKEWIEADSTRPKVGMAIIYDWSDTTGSSADNTSGHDHIGIVTSVGDKTFTVVEGNAGWPAEVRKRSVKINQKYIRGFISPDYDAIAKKLTVSDDPQHKNPTLDQMVVDVINGKYGSGAVRKSKLTSLYKKGESDYTYEQIQEAVNQKLESAPVYHKVVKGDTLSALAKKYDTTVTAICKLNNIKNANMICIGQKLRIK